MKIAKRQMILNDMLTHPYNYGQKEIIQVVYDNCFINRKEENAVLAENLYDCYGSLRNLLAVKPYELSMLDFVTVKEARVVDALCEAFRIIDENRVKVNVFKDKKAINDILEFRLGNCFSETLEIYCLNSRGKIYDYVTFSDESTYKVDISPEELLSYIVDKNPKHIIIAHNHPSGKSQPSNADIEFTLDTQYYCYLYGIELYDHLIYAGKNNIFSFKRNGLLNILDAKIPYYYLLEEAFDDLNIDPEIIEQIENRVKRERAQRSKQTNPANDNEQT